MKQLKEAVDQLDKSIWESFDHDDWEEFKSWLARMHERGADNLMFWGSCEFVAWNDDCTFDKNEGEYPPGPDDSVAPPRDYKEQLIWAREFFLPI